MGLAPRDHRRGRRPLPVRPAARDRPGRGPLAAWLPTASRRASTSRSAARTRRTRRPPGGRPGRWPARAGRITSSAAFAPDEAALAGAPGGLGLDLRLAATKPAALHDDDGWIDFGPAGGSYYYSRTAMTATGTLTVDGQALSVDGSAWFDHQWGDFISVGGGGWDWFAVNLDDGTDLTLSLVRDADGTYPLIYGTVVAPRRDRPASATGRTSRSRSPTAGRARRPAPTIRPAGRSRSRARTWRSRCGRRSPPRSSTRERRPASSTGRARRWSGPAGPGRRSVARATSS